VKVTLPNLFRTPGEFTVHVPALDVVHVLDPLAPLVQVPVTVAPAIATAF
jgi:hypothetical protein